MTTTALTTARPVRRRRRIGLAAVALLVVALPAAWWYQDSAAERDFEAAVAETDLLDPGWRLDDILAARRKIPDAQNSAKQVARIRTAGFWLGDKLENQLFAGRYNVPLHPQLAEVLRKRLEPLAEARDEAHKLKDMPDGRHDGDYDPVALSTSFEWLQHVRSVMCLLQFDMLLRLHDGDLTEIAGACRAEINAARSIGDEPLGIAHLVRIACLSIAAASITAA